MSWKNYRITSPFGWRVHPIRKINSFHTGIDLVKTHKAPIESFTAGKVVFAGAGKSGTGLGGYGNVVLIEDKNGRGHLYAHLHDWSVSKGQTVKKDQVIGRQGATGQVTGSHLHYEVRKTTSPSYGWIADRPNNCLDPTKYVDDLDRKTIDELAQEVMANKWGNNPERKKKLEAEGYDYKKVQSRVNELVEESKLKPFDAVVQEVIDLKWGVNPKRKKDLEKAGYDYVAIQREVNKRLM